jgi:hypothetical protein
MPASPSLIHPLYFGHFLGTDEPNRRPCGCFIDPVAFGHSHPVAPAEAAA